MNTYAKMLYQIKQKSHIIIRRKKVPIKLDKVKDLIGRRMENIPTTVVLHEGDNYMSKVSEMEALVTNRRSANELLKSLNTQIKADIEPKEIDDLPDDYELSLEAEKKFLTLKEFVVSTFHI